MADHLGHSAFFQNTACEYFPCHQGIAKEDFNCLFCYCPLYALGKKCGGACQYTDGGVKDCSACALPHRRENYDLILSRYWDILSLVKAQDAQG